MDPAPPSTDVTPLPPWPARRPDSHKGTFGRVLVVAGSRGMAGAAVLSGRAALRGGAGIVQVATPADVLPTVAAGHPCYLTAPLPHDDHGRLAAAALDEILALAAKSTAVALGPGLGTSPDLASLVAALVTHLTQPLVLDADALNLLAGQAHLLNNRPALVLTPHPGEFARLLDTSTADVQAHRRDHAVRFAAAHGLVLVLKGHLSLVTDGRRLFTNLTGNPGMATGGSGDVLTGLIAALLAQGLPPFEAAQLGAFLHGRAGDLARDRLGETSLLATDLLDDLPHAFRELAAAGPAPSRSGPAPVP